MNISTNDAKKLKQLTKAHAKWTRQRAKLYDQENAGRYPSSSDWQYSDEDGLALLEEFAAVAAQIGKQKG